MAGEKLIHIEGRDIDFSFDNVDQAVTIIKAIYQNEDVVLGELLKSITLDNTDLEMTMEIVAQLRMEIDGWKTVYEDEHGNHVFSIGS